MKEIFAKIVRSLKSDITSLKAVQKLLINSVGERDYSAQETCQATPGFVLLRQLPYKLQQFGHISGLSHFQSSNSQHCHAVLKTALHTHSPNELVGLL